LLTDFYGISAKVSDEAMSIASGTESDFGLTNLNRLKMSNRDSPDQARKFRAMIYVEYPR
jgi:hypothetical protein